MISLTPALPAAARSPASSHEAGVVSRVASWLAETVTSWFAEDPKGEMRPAATPLAVPARERPPQGRVAQPPGKRVKELTGKRSAYGRVWQLEDGREQLELSAQPLHVQDAHGAWKPIDTRLTAETSGASNSKSGFGSRFGDRLDRLAEIRLGERTLSLGVAGQDRQLTPKIAGSTVTYAGVWDGADLVYKLTPEGVKELIVLHKAPAADLAFTVTAPGLKAQREEDGSIAFVGDDGTSAVRVPKPFMIDQAADPASPYGRTFSDAVTQDVTQQGEVATITVKPAAGWLAAPERKWPVVIDPTFRVTPERFDTYVDSARKTTNFGEAWQLPVGKTTTGVNRALLRFNMPSELPIGAQIDDARLETYFDQALGETAPVTVEAREITREWDSFTATWNNQPTVSAQVSASVTRNPGELSRWHSFDVTALVTKWMSTVEMPMHGIMLKASDETKLGGPVYESSEDLYGGDGMIGETANHPRLVITYGKPSVTLSAGSTVTSQGASLSWTPYAQPADLVEYRLHRTCPSGCQSPTGGGAVDTLVATIDKDTTAYADTSSGGDPEAVADPGYIHEATYWVEAVLESGQVVPSQQLTVVLPRPGQISTVIYGSADTTLLAAEPGTPHDQPRLQAGNTATARSLITFQDYATQIPADALVTDASLSLWSANVTGTGARFDAHKLTKAFDENATWNGNAADFDPAVLGSATGLTSAPGWRRWSVTDAAKAWTADPAAGHGLMVKVADEAGTVKQQASFLSTEAAEPVLRPRLRVTYLEKSAGSSTFYAPQTPDHLDAGQATQVPVVVTNTTNETWPAGSTAVSYWWKQPDGTDLSTAGNQVKTPLPIALAPGETTLVSAGVTAPALSGDGTNKAEATTLDWDVIDTATGRWKSASHGLPQLPQRVRLDSPTSDQLGLEKFYSYTGKNTGAGSTALVNPYAGNLVWSYNALANPSRGPQTFVRMTSNSLDTSATSMGYGWSLQTSTLQRLGSPLQYHPRGQTWPSQVRLTDGDGTTHVWKLDTHGRAVRDCNPSVCDYTNPKGLHLYLQRVPRADDPARLSRDPLRQWVFTKPDRTQFFFDEDGYQSAVVDKNGNTMTFTYERRLKCFNKTTKFLQHITDAAGRRTLSIEYYKKGQDYTYIDHDGREVSGRRLTNPHILDNVQSITDLAGRKVTFVYTVKGLMAKMVDGAGDAKAKTFAFDYDSDWSHRNAKLVAVKDPRGNTTSFTYNRTHALDWCKLRLASIKDRLGGITELGYAGGPRARTVRATVTDPLRNGTVYVLDEYGRPEQIVNAKREATTLTWDGDHNVVKLTEANGAFATWKFDAKTGFPLELRDAEANHHGTPPTTLAYRSGLNGYVADLVEKTSPEGRTWQFGYDLRGNLKTVTDPLGVESPAAGDYTTSYDYDGLGRLTKVTDANGNPTLFADFEASGYPQKITDAYGEATITSYDVRGNVLSVTDALGKKTTQTYDIFKRPLEGRTPKDQAAGVFITTPAPEYDANDNVTTMTAPNHAVSTAVYDKADQLVTSILPKDAADGPERKATFTYDLAGNLKTQTEPKGAPFTTTYHYDPIYQLTDVVNAAQHKITYGYDNVGNTVKVVDPRKNATPATDDYTALYTFDRNHRATAVKDAAGNQTSTAYGLDGLVSAQIDAEGNTSLMRYDKRGALVETKVPHSSADGVIDYVVTQFAYDQVGNKTKTVTPRGVETTDDPTDFIAETRYDKLNRKVEELSPFDRDDPRYNTPDVVKYVYDEVSRLKEISAPPSHGQSMRNITAMTYWDNGWSKTSTDPWDIRTSYDYNELGQQTNRTLTSAGGSSQRAQDWSYYPDGKLKTHSDNGVPLDIDVLLADTSDPAVTRTGTFTETSGGASSQAIGPTAPADFAGPSYATAPAGTGRSVLTWSFTTSMTGKYTAWVKYPPGATATNATYAIQHTGGTAKTVVDQSKRGGTWVPLGSYAFTAGAAASITLSDDANGSVVADQIKLVHDSGAVDAEKKDFSYAYDVNANLTQLLDRTTTAKIDTWDIGYTGLNQVDRIIEKLNGVVKNTTTYAYNENGAVVGRTHDKTLATYRYDVRDLVDEIVNKKTATDPTPKTTRYTYTTRGERLTETKANGNTVTYDYFLDGLIRHTLEKKSNGALVAEHTIGYQGNLHRSRDISKISNADSPGSYLETTTTYTYDPRDRIAQSTKTPAGGSPQTETYLHDANGNVYEEEVLGKNTTFTYDRNRLISSATGSATSTYVYDPYGRLRSVNSGGTALEKYTYDGFDHITRHDKLNADSTTTVTRYAYDPLDRTTSKTEKEGSASAKTTVYSYLGLSEEVLDEEVAGKLVRSFQYTPFGERLSQERTASGGREESSYYGYNAHSDVEILTSDTGEARATYGYTAYGRNDDKLFTGIDKPDPADPTAREEYNPYRFNAKRWDNSTGMYDMGFRDYSPQLNRFLTLDSYNGALEDLSLSLDPWTANRYAFTGGNPITGIELDGHARIDCEYGYCTKEEAASNPIKTKPSLLPTPTPRKESAAGSPPAKKPTPSPTPALDIDAFYRYCAKIKHENCAWGESEVVLLYKMYVEDFVNCAKSDLGACGWAATGVFTFGLGKVLAPFAKAALTAGKPARVIRNRLDNHEFLQADDVVKLRGGEFVGQRVRNMPGIDGFRDGIPVSLKQTGSSSPAAILRHASKAEDQARKANRTGVELYIDAQNMSRNKLLDFIANGPLQDIPKQGTIGVIYIRTAAGWVVVPG
ncbi:DNRLRE domain-containing protein [Nonomuraea typhae]|uniref:DNRLRE domain-containing protein n=1 Tax=Nonomuraea typhae TaxID=2603600 RepID=A0ABW7YXC4_9ACTN